MREYKNYDDRFACHVLFADAENVLYHDEALRDKVTTAELQVIFIQGCNVNSDGIHRGLILTEDNELICAGVDNNALSLLTFTATDPE